MAKKAKQSIISKVTSWKVVLGIQLIASLLLVVLIFKLNALPLLYTIGVIVIVLVLALFSFLLMKPSKKEGKGKIRSIIGKIISILLSVLLMVATIVIMFVVEKTLGINSLAK